MKYFGQLQEPVGALTAVAWRGRVVRRGRVAGRVRVCPGNHQQPCRDSSKAEGGEDQKTDVWNTNQSSKLLENFNCFKMVKVIG